MDTTHFLASLWGPAVLAVSIGIFTSPKYYEKLYRELEKDALAVLALGMLILVGGIAQVELYSVWTGTTEILLTLLGWGAILKGFMLVAAPRYAEDAARSFMRVRLSPLIGIVTFVLGAYLTGVAFFS